MSENEELMQLFLTETDELFNTAEASLLSLETNPTSAPDVNELFRAFHTIKSGTAIVGFNLISEYVHKLENLLDKIRGDNIPVNRQLVSFLLNDLDFLRDLIDRSAQESPEIVTADMFQDRKEQVERFLNQMSGLSPDQGKPSVQETAPAETSEAEQGPAIEFQEMKTHMFSIAQDGDGTFRLSGELSINDINVLKEFLDTYVAPINKICLNMASVVSADAASLQLLIAFKRSLQPGTQWSVSELSPELNEYLSKCGLKKHLVSK